MPTIPQATSNPAVELEETGCLLCGSRNATTFVEAADPIARSGQGRYTVVRCHACGLCFTNPRPTPESIAAVYPSEYGPHQDRDARSSHSQRRGRWSRWMAAIRGRRQIAWHGGGRLLDFGCGAGSFLRRMHEEGWQVTGLDASSAVVERIRNQMGLCAFAGSLPHPELLPQSFDVITMWQALEHVHRPLDVLRAARQLLAPCGRLVIAVPNLESRAFRRFGPDWFGLDLPRHLIHFTPSTLRRMVEQAGFRVENIRTMSHASWLQGSAKRAVESGRAGILVRLLQFRPFCRLAAWSHLVSGSADAIVVTARF
ncbi:MAG: class I SAM-dependent methyltransferase [Pirellulales bacterium]|nr:class I SAM-dependent methyltransferase [Pirellulales bacterium]